MDDLISRKAAIDTLNDEFTVTGKTNAIAVQDYIRRVNNRLHDLPSAQPEIIRCKECVHSDTLSEGEDYDMPLKCLGIRYGGVMPDWYCEHAERRTDG